MKINRKKYEELLPKLGKRARKLLEIILEQGSVSTHELAKIGYGHPPRARQDLKDAGIDIITTFGKHPE